VIFSDNCVSQYQYDTDYGGERDCENEKFLNFRLNELNLNHEWLKIEMSWSDSDAMEVERSDLQLHHTWHLIKWVVAYC